ncbi:MAG: putative transposase [Candidatus Azotimanducaceae bacterium]|jgi:putative transposase
MQTLGSLYVRYVNYGYYRTGTLFEGRYKSSVVQQEAYFLSCLRYIELNPVRAGVFHRMIEDGETSKAFVTVRRHVGSCLACGLDK